MSIRLRFIAGLALGLAVGLLYGWVLSPVQYVDTSPDVLREDFRSDYVLMTAEAYSAEGDLARARMRLAALGSEPPLNYVVAAIDYGLENGYSPSDLQTLNRLAVDLRASPANPEIRAP